MRGTGGGQAEGPADVCYVLWELRVMWGRAMCYVWGRLCVMWGRLCAMGPAMCGYVRSAKQLVAE